MWHDHDMTGDSSDSYLQPLVVGPTTRSGRGKSLRT